MTISFKLGIVLRGLASTIARGVAALLIAHLCLQAAPAPLGPLRHLGAHRASVSQLRASASPLALRVAHARRRQWRGPIVIQARGFLGFASSDSSLAAAPAGGRRWCLAAVVEHPPA